MTITDLIARAKAHKETNCQALHGMPCDECGAIADELAKIDARPSGIIRSLIDGMVYTDASNAGLTDAATYCAEWERENGLRTVEEDE